MLIRCTTVLIAVFVVLDKPSVNYVALDQSDMAATPETSSNYIYATLPGNHIRVLTLLPALLPSQRIARIRCKLTTVPLTPAVDNSQQYEALSYVWGTDEPTNTIELNDHPYTVRDNLFAVLHVLRYERRPRTLWIDALCINQVDFRERSAQVGIMGDVYRNAKTVLAWLGEEYSGTKILFNVLSEQDGDVSKIYRHGT